MLTLTSGELKLYVESFLSEYLRHNSAATIGTYGRSLRVYARWVELQGAGAVFIQEEVQAYQKYLTETRKLSEVSIATYLTALRRFCQYLVDIHLLARNPATYVQTVRKARVHSRQVLSDSEIEDLLQSVDTSSQIGKRDLAIIYFMLYAGLSPIEIERSNLEDLEPTLYGWFLRVQGKGRKTKDEHAEVDPPVMEKIRIYLDTRPRKQPTAPLFISHGHRSSGERLYTRTIRSRISEHLHAAGITRAGVSPHSLTQTALLLWLNSDMSMDDIRQRMRYARLTRKIAHFREQGLLRRNPEELVETTW